MWSIPWQLKIATKLVLYRIPFQYRSWRRLGIFKLGEMERPAYALGVFRRHWDRSTFTRKANSFVMLELGPGDSLSSAVIARAFGAYLSYLVDIGPFAASEIAGYRFLQMYLDLHGLRPPDLETCLTMDDLLTVCSAKYLTSGLDSLRMIPSSSVDFIWSHTVLQHVRRHEVMPMLRELRRIQRPDGVSSHLISIADILGGNLNDLRFSASVWESSLMANSGFYTNRLRYSDFLEMFQKAGFDAEVRHVRRWASLPTPRRKMAPSFSHLTDDELQISSFEVLLR